MAYSPPKRATEYICYVGLTSQTTGLLQNNPTIAAGDFKVSIDGGALNNLTTLPAVTPAASRMVKITLSAAEMTGDNITVVAVDAAGAEWADQLINIQPSVRQIDDLATPTNITAGTITTVTNLTNAPTNGDLTATMKASVNAEVVDCLVTDTYAEPAAVPAATASLKDKIGWQQAIARNRITQTSTAQVIRNDSDSGAIGTSIVSDDGSTAVRGEFS